MTQEQDIEALLLLIEKLQEREIADLIEQPIAMTDARLSSQANKALSKVLKFYFHQLQDILQEKPSARLNLNMSHRNDPIATAIAELSDLVHIARKSAKDLTSAFEQERQKLLEQDWIKSHYTKIFDKLKGSKTLANLGEIFVVELAQAANAQVAVLLIASSAVGSSSDKSTDALRIVATYGRRIDSARPPISMGEGILGQCCLDRRIKYIDDTPADYVLLDSALGQTRIKSIAFLPIIFEDKVVGALEIGSIETFSKAQKALLELVSSSIGSNILSISAGMYNEKLLAEIAKTNYSLESQKRALDSSAIVAETDSRGIITYVNDKFLEISKYSLNELMGQDHRILNSGHHPKEFFVQLWRTVAKGEIWKNEVKNRAKDGTFYWVDTTIYPVKDSDGKLQKLIAIRFDTSSRKAAEDQLRSASSSLISQKLALDSAAIVAETDNRGCITYVNEKFIEVSKYSRVDLIGQDHRILNSGHHPKEFFVDLWKTIAKGHIWHGEVKNKAADGSYYWVDTTVYPAKDETGKILKYVAIRFDITDRKAAEESLRQATLNANAASEAKAQFLANISHEIRTPMNGIIGFTSLLSEQNLDQDQARSVQIIRNCSEHLLVLINDFLDFSKIEAGKVDLEIRPFDLKQLIEESCYLVNEMVEKKTLHLKKFIAVDSPRFVMSDPTRVRQILINLISNAVKFTENGAITLTLEAKPKDGDSYELLFCVKDSGIGIATENIDKLFTAFSQAETSTTRRFGGTGLGLAICKKMVELLGGRIWVESKEGQGSSFYFTIVAKSANPHQNSLEAGAINGINSNLGKDQPLNILVAEDNSVNQLLVKSLLAKLGYTATFVSNGRQAVNAAANEPYDVILMDIQMPEMDGFTATREILSKQNGKAGPEIIALTANAMDDDRKKCLACGMTGFIPKPFRLTNLSDELTAAIMRIKKRATAA